MDESTGFVSNQLQIPDGAIRYWIALLLWEFLLPPSNMLTWVEDLVPTL